MFDDTSRSELVERLAYERWLVRNCIDLFHARLGRSGRATFFIDDANPMVHRNVLVSDSVSAGKMAELVADFSPLLFCSAFKIMDQVIEWCYAENGVSPKGKFWGFEEKIQRMGEIQSWPDFFNTQPDIAKAFNASFERLRLKRNAIVHHQWGKNTGGNLEFDLELPKNAGCDTDIIPLEAIIDLADLTIRIADVLTIPTAETPTAFKVESIKHLANSIAAIHRQPLMPAKPAYSVLVVLTTLDSEVDFDRIRTVLAKWRPDTDCHFELEVKNRLDFWLIPEIETDALAGKVELKKLDRFKKAGPTHWQ